MQSCTDVSSKNTKLQLHAKGSDLAKAPSCGFKPTTAEQIIWSGCSTHTCLWCTWGSVHAKSPIRLSGLRPPTIYMLPDMKTCPTVNHDHTLCLKSAWHTNKIFQGDMLMTQQTTSCIASYRNWAERNGTSSWSKTCVTLEICFIPFCSANTKLIDNELLIACCSVQLSLTFLLTRTRFQGRSLAWWHNTAPEIACKHFLWSYNNIITNAY